MAKQIEELLIRLGIDGYEDIAKLKSAFRSLEGTVKESDDVIERARKSLLDYGRSSNQTQDLLRGMVTSLNALKAKANENGEAYRKLQRDQKRYAEQLYGATDAIVKQRDALVQNAKAVQTSSASVYRYITGLKKLRAEVRDGTAAAAEFDKEIAALSQRMQQLKQVELSNAFKTAKEGAQGLWGVVKGVHDTTASATQKLITLGRKINDPLVQAALSPSGVRAGAAAGAVTGTAVTGAFVGGGITSAVKGVYGAQIAHATAMSNLLTNIQEKTQNIPGLRNLISPDQIGYLQDTVDKFSALQAKVGVVDGALHAVSNSLTALGPAGVAAATMATVGIAAIGAGVIEEGNRVARQVEEDFVAVNDETQKLLRNLAMLGDQLSSLSSSRVRELLGERMAVFQSTPAGTAVSRSQASQIAGLESILRQELATQAVTLEEYRSRVRGSSQSLEDLGERMSFVQSRMKVLDTSTADGAREFGALKQEAMSLTAQMEALASSYAHVSTRAVEARTAQENAANAAMRGAYLNTPTTRYRPSSADLALQELRMRMMAGAQAMGTTQPIPGRTPGTTLALPAAGGTSAAGTGLEMSGGARRLRGQVEYTFQAPIDVGGAQVPNYMRDPRYTASRGLKTTAAVGAPPAVGYSGADPSLQRAIPAYKEAQQELAKVLLSSNNTIKSLEAQRSAWGRLRNAIDPASSTFANATKRIQALDEKLDGLSTKIPDAGQGKPAFSARRFAATAGAALSGGVFGGPEGFLGGAVGGLLGGEGGAFAGAALGAQLAGLRQAAAGTAEYAAAINQQRRALAGVVEDNTAYQQSLAYIDQTSRQLAIPQEQITQQFTRLSASVIGAGGDVTAAQEAFSGIAAGIRATGGSLADMDAAMLATAQVFSKGKVSAEELRGQIGERLPGAFTLFAQSIGKTPQELDKMLDKGQVTLDDFMAFVRTLSSEFGATALQMAASSEAAGDRMATSWARAQESIGKALQPVGAAFQETFAELTDSLAPALVSTLEALAPVLLNIAENFDVVLASVTAMGAAMAVVATVQIGGLVQAFAKLRAAILASNAALLLNPWVLLAAGVTAASVALIKHGNAQRDFNALISSGAGSTAQMSEAQKKLEKDLALAKKQLENLGTGTRDAAGDAAILQKRIKELEIQLAKLKGTYTVRLKLEQEGYTFDAEGNAATYKDAQGTVYDAKTGQAMGASRSQVRFGGATGDSAAAERDRAAQTLLQAIERREEAIAAARIAREEQLASIRRQAVEQAGALERTFAEQRLAQERNLAAARRQLATAEAGVNFERQALDVAFQGGDPEAVRIQQRLFEAARQRDEERIAREQQLQDDQAKRTQAIEDFKRTNAQAINEANVRYAKAIGDAQKEYAKAVAGIIEQGTGRASKRLEAAGRLASAYINQATAGQAFQAISDVTVSTTNQGGYLVNGEVYSTGQEFIGQAFAGSRQQAAAAQAYVNATADVINAQRAAMGAPAARPQTASTRSAAPASNTPFAFQVDTTDLDANVKRASASIGVVELQVEGVKQKLADTEYYKKFLDEVGRAVAPVAQTFRSLKEDVAEPMELLKRREAGMSKDEAAKDYAIDLQYRKARNELEVAYNTALQQTPVEQQEELKAEYALMNAELEGMVQRAREFNKTLSKTPATLRIRQGVVEMRDDLNELTDIGNNVMRGAQVIEQEMSSAMAAAVTSVVTGSGSIKEALGNAFEAIGQSFIKMATDIIAKQLVMITLQTILKALGAATAGTGSPNMDAVGSYADSASSVTINDFPAITQAKGGAFDSSGYIERYAMGGIVKSPTMFRFAKGGQADNIPFQRGLMGEAGPEAILPLRRGPDGRLGVQALPGATAMAQPLPFQGGSGSGAAMAQPLPFQGGSGSGAAMAQPIPFTRTREQRYVERTDRETIAAINNPKPLEVKYESQVINGVEYVTTEQHQKGMAQAAERGRALALEALQNSVKTRRKVGVI